MSWLVPPVAQGAGEWIGILLVILFIVVPAILQMLGKGQQPPARRPRPARPPGAPPAGGQVEDEIEEFLRRAVQRRGGEPPPPPPQPRPPARPVAAEVVREAPVGGRVSEHTEEYLESGDFNRRASQLGKEVARTDEQLEERLHQKFDQEVSRLATLPGEAAGAPMPAEPPEPEDRVHDWPATAAAGLPALLGSAAGIRQAIVINEILQRPEHRWS